MRSSGFSVVSVVLVLVLALVTPAWGQQAIEIPAGVPAPFSGVLIPNHKATELVERLRDGAAAAATVETQKAELQVKDEQIAALKEAVAKVLAEADARREAMIRADERDKIRAEQNVAMREVLTDVKDMLKEARAENASLRRHATTDKWALGGLVGLAVLAAKLLTGGF